MEGHNDSFWLICNNNDPATTECHCDWRTTIVDCIERQPMLYIYSVNAVLSILITIVGSFLLHHRVIHKKQRIFDYEFLRPKPVEAMLFFGIIFNFLRAIDSILLVTDALSNVMILRAFLYEVAWQFGLCALGCYLFGIARTIINSSSIIHEMWIHTTILIDIMCCAMISLPFITNNICSISAAYYAQQGDLDRAKLFTDALYYLWTVYCFTLAMGILIAGILLLNLLQRHLGKQQEHDDDDETQQSINTVQQKIKTGAFKIRMIMAITVSCLLIFSLIKACYAVFRVPLLGHTVYSLVTASIWTFDGTLTSILVIGTLLINPKALAPLSMPSNNRSRTESELYNATTTTATSPKSQLTDNNTNEEESSQGRGYPLSNMYFTTIESVKDHNMSRFPYITSFNFNQHLSSVSETHLVHDVVDVKII